MQNFQHHYDLTDDWILIDQLHQHLRHAGYKDWTSLRQELRRLDLKDLQAVHAYLSQHGQADELAWLWQLLVLRFKQIKLRSLEEFSSSSQVGLYLCDQLGSLLQERLLVLYLDAKNQLVGQKVISQGTLNKAIAHPRDIFRWAVIYNCAGMIVAHNHPSGHLAPSQQDLRLSQKLENLSQEMGISFWDHFIVSEQAYLSFRERGYLIKS
ncbi:MAG: DNA repair protein RadC [Lactobacillus sp.]|jgi:DNA repair protein RadC|nr:DNA repair protein RadC [Lactobacillus sp.]MCH4069358.1 DNA repair protein RadC [Lactobacillus sp.]MCI1303654.1 DNA repair protein RadC [Lactobacillus sp.]MCI1329837.1 DNA repair protein RadC [Lactobacillus sp.]MCI1359513.1 DNA repair protein RadC [Lactobacillus sp.]